MSTVEEAARLADKYSLAHHLDSKAHTELVLLEEFITSVNKEVRVHIIERERESATMHTA